MGLNAIGVEILEIGKLISEVKCGLDYDIKSLRREIKSKLKKHTEENRFYTNIIPHIPKIIYLKNKIKQIEDKKIRNFLLLLLSQKIVEFSEKKAV